MSVATHKHAQKVLPPGWRWVRLGDFMPRKSGTVNPATCPSETFTLFSIPSFDRGTPETVLGKSIGSSKQLVQPGDVLLSKIVPHIKRTWVVENLYGARLIASTEWIIFRTEKAVPDYLKYALLDEDFHKSFMDTTSGVGGSLTRARPSLVAKLEIPLPPLPEQQRIAAILKEQMAAVDKARAAAEARLEAVKALPAAFRNQIFPRPDQKLAVDWKRKALGAVLEITSGQVDPKDARYKDLPHVNGENIESGTGRLLNVRSAAEDNMTSGKYLFESGVVLYSKLRPYLMKVSVAHFRGLCSADMYPLTPHLHEMTLEFLQQLLLSEAFTNYAVAESQRARMPKLNRDQLMAYSAPVPPLADQRRLAARLREQMDAAEKARAAAEAELDAINALPAALLRRAFNGGL
ncbi:MAG: EcoKI restriction-modification system protein HsdS [Verrucomicrobia bacterium ADurb.Bin122]|nr:MAG: EcoKI restriction-modification system protein HsdS [Verrucomicrobia bacterium ADurb.Bin122]